MMDTTDKDIARLLQHKLPEAGHDPWFKSKVLNRLPRRRSQTSPVEWVCIAAVCVLLLVALVIEGFNIIGSQQILVRDIVIMSSLTMISLGVGGWIISPYIRN